MVFGGNGGSAAKGGDGVRRAYEETSPVSPVRVGTARRRIGPRRICAAVLDSPTCTGGADRI